MYPFSSDVYAVRNQWYVASFSRDVTRKPLERWILDEPVVFYRTEAGAPVALEGRCAHRQFPLGEGALVGDNIQCPYHGFTYATDGRCVRVPSQDRAPQNCAIKSYPTVEKWRWIWIWMGDPALADPALIPNHDDMGLTDPEFAAVEVYHEEIEARHQLLHDNLLDLSHVAFLHGSTLGGGSEATAIASYPQSKGPNWLRSDRLIRKTQVPPHFAHYLGRGGECDRYMPMFFYMPALHVGMDDYRVPAKDETSIGESFGKLLVHHAVTPARRNTTHYFFATARNFAKDAEAEMVAAFNAVIREDSWGLAAVERMLRALGDRIPPDFNARADTQQLLGRRLMEQLIVDDMAGSDLLSPPDFSLKDALERLYAAA
jgi:phenylpropionate dioxygenase-like ring-hydroxylating dioxygenase large terminal subunit